MSSDSGRRAAVLWSTDRARPRTRWRTRKSQPDRRPDVVDRRQPGRAAGLRPPSPWPTLGDPTGPSRMHRRRRPDRPGSSPDRAGPPRGRTVSAASRSCAAPRVTTRVNSRGSSGDPTCAGRHRTSPSTSAQPVLASPSRRSRIASGAPQSSGTSGSTSSRRTRLPADLRPRRCPAGCWPCRRRPRRRVASPSPGPAIRRVSPGLNSRSGLRQAPDLNLSCSPPLDVPSVTEMSGPSTGRVELDAPGLPVALQRRRDPRRRRITVDGGVGQRARTAPARGRRARGGGRWRVTADAPRSRATVVQRSWPGGGSRAPGPSGTARCRHPAWRRSASVSRPKLRSTSRSPSVRTSGPDGPLPRVHVGRQDGGAAADQAGLLDVQQVLGAADDRGRARRPRRAAHRVRAPRRSRSPGRWTATLR